MSNISQAGTYFCILDFFFFFCYALKCYDSIACCILTDSGIKDLTLSLVVGGNDRIHKFQSMCRRLLEVEADKRGRYGERWVRKVQIQYRRNALFSLHQWFIGCTSCLKCLFISSSSFVPNVFKLHAILIINHIKVDT